MPSLRSLVLLFSCVVAAASGAFAHPTMALAGSPAASGSAVTARSPGPGSPSRPTPRAAGDAATPESGAPSTVLYPEQRLPLRFDHARHARVGLSCAYCHTQATKSRSVADRLLPPAERCDACHGTDHEHPDRVEPGVGAAADCVFCHEGHRAEDGNRVARVAVPPANLRFDHAVHTSRGIACKTCHAGVESAALATRRHLPRMQACTSCHAEGGAASGDCDVCHVTVSGSRIRTSFDTGELLPPPWMHGAEHGPDWLLRHKLAAGSDSAFCATCHSEQECVDCHDGRVRPRKIHPNDWLGLHAMAARQNDPSCMSCHREQSFCITCHQRAGVAMSGPSANTGDRGRFHPPKSVWTDAPRTPRHHAWEAERNIQACVSCHAERDCALCHATAARGGRGGLSPHPVGFDATCGAALAKNARPCLYCHDAGDGSLSRCR